MHLRNPLLPDTRSEAGIPIRAGNMVLGALDVQSTEPRAFGPETVVMLQTLANQIAAAVQNMTLVESSQTNMQELERLYSASRKIVGAQSREQVLARTAELVAEPTYPTSVAHGDATAARAAGASGYGADRTWRRMLQALPILESHLAEVRRYVSGGPVIAEQSSLGLPLALLDFTRQVGHRSVAFLPINQREELAGLVIVGSPNRPLSTRADRTVRGLG